MPLTNDQQARLDEIKKTLAYTSQMLEGMKQFPRQISALQKLDTRGEPLDFDEFSTDELRDIYERGRVNSDINGCDLEHPYSPGNLQHVTLEHGFQTDDEGNLTPGTAEHPIDTSRESLVQVINNWMHSNNQFIDPRNLAAAQINVLGSIDRGLGGKIEKAKFDYMNLQEEVKLSGGGDFHDAGFEASYQDLKAGAEDLTNFANNAQSSLALNGAANSIAAAAGQGLSPAKAALAIDEAKRLITGQDMGAIDLTGQDLTGLDVSMADLSGIKYDAETLSRTQGLSTAVGVDPDVKAAAKSIKPDVQALDALRQQKQQVAESMPSRTFGRIVGQLSGSSNQKKAEIAQLDDQIQAQQNVVAAGNVTFTPPPRQVEATRIAPPKPGPQSLVNQLQTQGTYVVGKGALEPKVAAGPQNAMQKAQASETFRVSGSQILSESGATSAFAKKAIGSRSASLKAAGADDMELNASLGKDGDQIGTVAPLYGKSEKVGKCDAFDVPGRKQAIEADLSSLPSRSVASSVVNQALKMDSVAEEKYGVDLEGNPMGISVGVPGAAIRTRPSDPTEAEAFLDIDYTNPQVQKGLFDLEAQDYITGQIDRHGGNIFIDPHTNEVRGIDNDLAFPVVERSEMLKQGDVSNKAVATLPMFVHEDTAAKIKALSPADLRQQLESIEPPPGVAKLEPAAIDGACKRLVELQDHIGQLEAKGALIKEFDGDTYKQARAAQLAKTNDNVLGGPNNGSIARASYLGSAMIEKARTEVLNAREDKPWEHRKLLDASDVPEAEPNQLLQAYQAELDSLEKVIVNNDPGVKQQQQQVDQLREAVAQAGAKVDAAAANAVGGDRRAQMAARAAAIELDQVNQQLGQAEQALDDTIKAKMEPLKATAAESAAEKTMAQFKAAESQAQAELAPLQAELDKVNATLDQKWNNVLGSSDAGDLSAEIAQLTQQQEQLEKAVTEATKKVDACSAKIAGLEARLAESAASQNLQNDDLQLDEEVKVDAPDAQNAGWKAVEASSPRQQNRVQLGRVPDGGGQQVEGGGPARTPPARRDLGPPPGALPAVPGQAPVVPAKVSVSVAASMAQGQRPVLKRPPGPAPMPPGVSPAVEGGSAQQAPEAEPQAWKSSSTGAMLDSSNEATPRVQRSNSVGSVSKIPSVGGESPPANRKGPVIGGNRN